MTDAILQPFCTGLIELTLWIAIFAATDSATIAGFSKEYYLAYVLWTAFVTRITTNWMYESRMIEEIELGSINGLIVRPMSFYEYYLSQFLGYKAITSSISFIVPIAMIYFMKLPTDFSRLPLALLLICYYLLLVHTISFLIATVAFHLNRVQSLTVAKNLALWVFTGELFPLDILPEPYRSFILDLPFANAVYIPVGYLTGRFNMDLLLHGFWTNTMGLIFIGGASALMWKWGLSKYSGTGA